MEENTNATEQNTQAENMGNETDVQGQGKEPKMFTQEEVNGFVKGRIDRLRGQISKEAKEEYDQKLSELQAREMKLLVKEKLDERKMPLELASIITCADENDLITKLDAIEKIYGTQEEAPKAPKSGFRPLSVGVAGGSFQGSYSGGNPIRKAMGLE